MENVLIYHVPSYSLEAESVTELASLLIANNPQQSSVSVPHGTGVTDSCSSMPGLYVGLGNLYLGPLLALACFSGQCSYTLNPLLSPQ